MTEKNVIKGNCTEKVRNISDTGYKIWNYNCFKTNTMHIENNFWKLQFNAWP
jgi:hypothetical protein